MSIGPKIRRLLGPVEAPISSAYRSMFVSITSLGEELARVPFGPRVLEVGVGDGMVAAQILSRRTDATVLGIDLAENPGGLFEGDRSRVTFRTISTSDLLAEKPEPFDAIMIADVLHHVPVEARAGLLADVDALLAEDGILIVKESVVMKSIGYWMGHFSDYWITGDKNVSYLRETDLRQLVLGNVTGLEPIGRTTIKPWKMNLMLVWRRVRS